MRHITRYSSAALLQSISADIGVLSDADNIDVAVGATAGSARTSGGGGGGPPKVTARRVASQPPPRSSGKDGTQAGPDPLDGRRTHTLLSREASKFLASMGVGIIDPRSGQQAVNFTFSTARAADESFEKVRALDTEGVLRLAPDRDKLAPTRKALCVVNSSVAR